MLMAFYHGAKKMDMLRISKLSTMSHIGIHAWEQRILQPLLFDIEIPKDFSLCEDQLDKTIDYDELCQRVTAFVETNSFNLIETVAEKVAQLIKNEFQVDEVTICVCKPHAIKNAENVCVKIRR